MLLKAHSNGPLYINMVIGALAVDGWAACAALDKVIWRAKVPKARGSRRRGDGVWRAVSPSQWERGLGGLVPPLQKFF